MTIRVWVGLYIFWDMTEVLAVFPSETAARRWKQRKGAYHDIIGPFKLRVKQTESTH